MNRPERNRELADFSTAKKIAFSLVPSAALLLLAFAVGEVALRCHYGQIERITGALEWEPGSWRGLTYFWDQYHPSYGWTNLPGYRSDHRVPFRVSINRQGLRGTRDYPSRPPAGVRRVAVFGDSCTFGEEVDDDQTIPAYLERHLDGVEALNFGVRGYGLGQMALRLEGEGFALNPEYVVIVNLIPSDILRDSVDRFSHNKPIFGVEGTRLRIGNVPVPEASLQPWLYRYSFTAAWLFARPLEWPRPENLKGHLAVARAILDRTQARSDAEGIPLTLVNVIAPGDVVQKPPRTQRINYIRTSLGSMDLDVLDLVGFLRKAYAKHGQALVAPIAHWAAPGNCLIAGRLAEHLAERGSGWTLDPERPRCAQDLGGS